MLGCFGSWGVGVFQGCRFTVLCLGSVGPCNALRLRERPFATHLALGMKQNRCRGDMTRDRSQSLEMLSFNILTCPHRSTMRIPVVVVRKHGLDRSVHGLLSWMCFGGP